MRKGEGNTDRVGKGKEGKNRQAEIKDILREIEENRHRQREAQTSLCRSSME